MTGKDVMFTAFDRLFDRAVQKLGIECSDADKEEAKRQFAQRFEALLEALHTVDIGVLPDKALEGMEGAIDQITPAQIAGLIASLPIAHQGQQILRGVAYRAAEQKLVEHLIEQTDDRYGGN